MTMNEVIQPIDLSLRFDGHRVAFDGSASFGGGGVTVKGSADWKEKAITHYDGEVHMHTPSINSACCKKDVDADLSLGEFMDQLGVTGKISIHNATCEVPLALLAESGESSANFLTKIDIAIGDNVRLYSRSLYDLMIKGNISMMGHFREPIMTGRVNVEKGTVRSIPRNSRSIRPMLSGVVPPAPSCLSSMRVPIPRSVITISKPSWMDCPVI